MDTSIKPIDTRREAIRAMADALAGMDYTRDDLDKPIRPKDTLNASGQMLLAIAKMRDAGFAREFLTEVSDDAVLSATRLLALYMMGHGDALECMDAFSRNARWYGEEFIKEALSAETMPSADEIARGRHVDEQIKQAKEAV